MVVTELFKWMSLGFIIVLVGILLKDSSGVNTIMSGFASSYGSILGSLEKAG